MKHGTKGLSGVMPKVPQVEPDVTTCPHEPVRDEHGDWFCWNCMRPLVRVMHENGGLLRAVLEDDPRPDVSDLDDYDFWDF